ncbi:MAG: glycosyltransferase family 2 protein [Chitinophagales bacterium]
MQEKKVGIVTVTYNSGTVLQPFLDCIVKQSYHNFILYIIDNVSTDDSVAIAETCQDPRIRLFKNNVNSGVAGGNNQGIFAAFEDGCDFIWLVNNDVEFETTYLEKLVKASESTGHSMITSKMMYYFDQTLIWYAGSFFQKNFGYVANHIGLREKDEGQYNSDRIVDYAPTCSVLFKKEVFEDIGFMDEQYFAYYDDTDFLVRAYLDGRHQLYYLGDLEFYHKIGVSSQSKKGGIRKFKFGDFHIKLTTRNKVYYLRKQQSLIAWINIIYFYLRLNLRFLFSGKYNRNFKTWQLIQRSFKEGMKMELPDKNYKLVYNK